MKILIIFIVGLAFVACICSTIPFAYAHHEKVIVRITPQSHNFDCASNKSCHHPSVLTIQAGRTVEWQNRDDFYAHAIVSGSSLDFNGGSLFSSDLIKPHNTFSFTFKNAGKYNYFCSIHPWATGVIIIR